MVISFVPWFAIPTVAFWPVAKAAKAAWVTGLLIAAEVLFWGGVTIGGAEVLRHRRAFVAIVRRRLGTRVRRQVWPTKRHKKHR